MPFGHKAGPTIVYSFDFRPDDPAELHEILRAAHRYRNKLVEIELERRAAVEVLLHRVAPQVAGLADRMAALNAEIDQLELAVRESSKAARKRTAVDKETSARLKHLKALRRELATELKAARKAAFESLEFKVGQEEVDAKDLADRKAARAASGVNWGTYLAVEQAMGGVRSGRPPQFRRYDGGVVAVQIQKGMSAAAALDGSDRRLRLSPDPSRSRCLRVDLQLGANWRVAGQLRLQRPTARMGRLPEDARIKGVRIVHRRVATHDVWSIQFTLERETGWSHPSRAAEGVVAVNLGWRSVADGLRVATWLGSDGESGTLVLAGPNLTRPGEADAIKSIRDVNFNTIRLQLLAWMEETGDLPEWLAEATQTLRQWRSQARLVGLVLRWRDNRFPGDESILAECEAWRQQDRHLYDWEGNTSRRHIAWRRDTFRKFARMLADRYGRLAIASVNWKQMGTKPDPEESDEMRLVRQRRRVAAPGMLDMLLRQTFGTESTDRVSPIDLTRHCHACGGYSGQANTMMLYHTCGQCGETWDQDVNHCHNLLRAVECQPARDDEK